MPQLNDYIFPAQRGGRGMMMVEHQWEKEQLSLVVYLHKSSDPWLQAVLRHMIALSQQGSTNPVSACRAILRKYDVQVPKSTIDIGQIKSRVGKKQIEGLRVALRDKVVHGVTRVR